MTQPKIEPALIELMATAIVCPTQVLSYAELEKLRSYSVLCKQAAGTRIAIIAESNVFAAIAIAILQSSVRSLFLIPVELDDKLKARFLSTADIELILADHQVSTEVLENRVRLPFDSVESLLELESTVSAAQLEFDTQWILATSGTTNTPKLIKHTYQSLTRTISYRISGPDIVWGLAYSVLRFAGLQVLLQSLAAKNTIAIPDETGPLGQRLIFLADCGCNSLSATPSLWRKILMQPESKRLSLQQITLGGEIADQQILNALVKQWPGARVIHIYASTEAGVGFVVSDKKAGFPADYLCNPPKNVELAVGKQGNLLIRPPIRDQDILSTDSSSVFDQTGFIDTGDLIELREDRYHFLGRDSGAINVGGDKLIPEEIERVLLDFPQIIQALVYGRSNPILGQVVAAKIVQEENTPTGIERTRSIKMFCAQRLSRNKIPAIIEYVAELDMNQSGKLQRKNHE